METSAYDDYPQDIVEKAVNGCDVRIVGVNHEPAFYDEYEDVFDAELAAADAALIEQPVDTEFWESDFFGAVGDLAAQHDTTVYSADPCNRKLFYADVGLGSLALFGAATEPIEAVYDERTADERQAAEDETQWAAFKRLARTGSSLSVAAGTLPGSIVKRRHFEETEDSYGSDDRLSYGGIDYRNVMIADGIERITAIEPYDRVTAVHGAGHTAGITGYLDEATTRNVKKTAYTPFHVLSRNDIREYEHDEADGWAVERTF